MLKKNRIRRCEPYPFFSISQLNEIRILQSGICNRLTGMANFFMDDLNPFKDSYNFMDVPLDSSYYLIVSFPTYSLFSLVSEAVPRIRTLSTPR
jgi:hypothetical protein